MVPVWIPVGHHKLFSPSETVRFQPGLSALYPSATFVADCKCHTSTGATVSYDARSQKIIDVKKYA